MLSCFTVRRSGEASGVGGGWRGWTALVLVACAQADGTTPDAAGAGAGGGAGAPLLSDAEWRESTGPLPGVHDVYGAACGEQPISQDYRIVPPIQCIGRRDESGRYIPIRDCSLADYCQTAADCAAQSRGVCVGSPSDSCEYPGIEVGAPCERDADCNALTGGSCTAQIGGGEERCYPTGECTLTPMQSCTYPALYQPCTIDADCSAAPGGWCRRTISFTQCAYNECDTASDCAAAERCECFGVRQCLPASCFGDSECDAGYRCEPTLALLCGNLQSPVGYHCHSASDECQSDTDCGNLSCVFDPEVSHWACRDIVCLTR